ncbi:CHAD domain-containing protein [soil metagenome]
MVDGKTIPGLKPETTMTVAAKKILSARLNAVTQRLKPAATIFHEDDEHVHQLRVASRRADASLRMFVDYLPAKRVVQARETLRTLRRAAGPARDWDVFRTLIVDAKPNDPLKYFLLGISTHHRHHVQKPLEAVITDELTEWPKLARALPAAVDASSKTNFGEVIDEQVQSLVKKMVRHLDRVSPTTSILELHRLRILGKRLRYTLELAPGPQADAKMLGALEHLQDILGDWHDAHAAWEHLTAAKQAAASANGVLHPSLHQGLNSLIKRYEKQNVKQSQLFGRWLKQWNVKQ